MLISHNLMLGAGGGGPPLGLFAGGSIIGTQQLISDLYNFGKNTMTATTSLGMGRGAPSGTGTPAFAIIAGGINTVPAVTGYVDQYTYSSAAIANHTALSIAKYAAGSAGDNSTFGLMAGGTPSTITNATEKYTYATYTGVAGTVLTASGDYFASTANATLGLFSGGFGGGISTVTNKYTWSGSTVAAGTALGASRFDAGGAGTSALGIIAGSGSTYLATSDKYTYSGDVRVAATSISSARAIGGAANSPTKGSFAGGITSTVTDNTTNDIYTFSGDTVASGTVLNTGKHTFAGASSAFA